jgi:hypothetical protein
VTSVADRSSAPESDRDALLEQLRAAETVVRELTEELAETNRGVVAL